MAADALQITTEDGPVVELMPTDDGMIVSISTGTDYTVELDAMLKPAVVKSVVRYLVDYLARIEQA